MLTYFGSVKDTAEQKQATEQLQNLIIEAGTKLNRLSDMVAELNFAKDKCKESISALRDALEVAIELRGRDSNIERLEYDNEEVEHFIEKIDALIPKLEAEKENAKTMPEYLVLTATMEAAKVVLTQKRNTEYLRQLMNELTRAIYVVAQSLAPFEAEMDKLETNIDQMNNRQRYPALYAGVQPKVARAELI